MSCVLRLSRRGGGMDACLCRCGCKRYSLCNGCCTQYFLPAVDIVPNTIISVLILLVRLVSAMPDNNTLVSSFEFLLSLRCTTLDFSADSRWKQVCSFHHGVAFLFSQSEWDVMEWKGCNGMEGMEWNAGSFFRLTRFFAGWRYHSSTPSSRADMTLGPLSLQKHWRRV